jgi:hypothetical protein
MRGGGVVHYRRNPNPMNLKKYIISTVLLTIFLFPVTVLAEILILKTGKELEVEKTWQEGDLICFIFHELRACILPNKVLRIDRKTKEQSNILDGKQDKKADSKMPDSERESEIFPDQTKLKTQPISTSQAGIIPSESACLLRRDGFHDLPWGIKLSKVDGLKPRNSFSGLNEVIEYVRPKDILQIGDAQLKSIVYSFWRDKLYTVTIWTMDYSNYTALRDEVFQQFSISRPSDSSCQKHLWSVPLTDLMMEYDENAELGMLWLRSSELDRIYKLSQMNDHATLLKWMKSRN